MKVVNSAKFQLYKICQILLFFYRPEYKLFWVETLLVGRVHYCLRPHVIIFRFFYFFWNMIFKFYQINGSVELELQMRFPVL